MLKNKKFNQSDIVFIGLLAIILFPVTLMYLLGALLTKVGMYIADKIEQLNDEYDKEDY